MKILAQVNRIKNVSEKEIEEAENKDSNSDFVYCTFPTYEGEKLCGIDENVRIISVLGDPSTVFFDDSPLVMKKILCGLDMEEKTS